MNFLLYLADQIDVQPTPLTPLQTWLGIAAVIVVMYILARGMQAMHHAPDDYVSDDELQRLQDGNFGPEDFDDAA